MKKTVSLLKWDNGFVIPIKVYPGPQGGAYLPSEIIHMVPEDNREGTEVVIYEIKETTRTTLEDLGAIKDTTGQ